MLPANSPRWADLMCDLGSAESIGQAFQQAYEMLEQADCDKSKIHKAVSLAARQISHLYHQQTTYSASAAAMPHLLHFATLSDLKQKTGILAMIGFMDYDHAGDWSPDDLHGAYCQAIHESETWAEQLLRSKKLTREQQGDLFVAIALIRRTCIYTIRNEGLVSFECAGCQADLEVDRQDGTMVISFDGGSVPLERTNDLAAEFQRPVHRELGQFYQLAEAGGHKEFIEWLSQFLGTFVCPACETDQQVNYDNQ